MERLLSLAIATTLALVATTVASVTFLQFRAYNDDPGVPIVPLELSERTTFAAGITSQFVNWAPAPPQDPAPPEGPLPTHMRAFVESGAAIEPIPGAPTQTDRAMVLDFRQGSALPGPLTERIAVFVGTIACTDVRFAEVSPPIILLGAVGQPDACSTEGSEITFLQIFTSGQVWQLFEETSFAAGSTHELTNWAPQPPHSALPGYMQSFLDAGAVIQPAGSGNAGLKGSRTSPPATVTALTTILFLAAARRLTAGRPD